MHVPTYLIYRHNLAPNKRITLISELLAPDNSEIPLFPPTFRAFRCSGATSQCGNTALLNRIDRARTDATFLSLKRPTPHNPNPHPCTALQLNTNVYGRANHCHSCFTTFLEPHTTPTRSSLSLLRASKRDFLQPSRRILHPPDTHNQQKVQPANTLPTSSHTF